jgi:hypothetical protein
VAYLNQAINPIRRKTIYMNLFKRWRRSARIRVGPVGFAVLVSDVLETSARGSDLDYGKQISVCHTLDGSGDFIVMLTRRQAKRLFARSPGLDIEARYGPSASWITADGAVVGLGEGSVEHRPHTERQRR